MLLYLSFVQLQLRGPNASQYKIWGDSIRYLNRNIFCLPVKCWRVIIKLINVLIKFANKFAVQNFGFGDNIDDKLLVQFIERDMWYNSRKMFGNALER